MTGSKCGIQNVKNIFVLMAVSLILGLVAALASSKLSRSADKETSQPTTNATPAYVSKIPAGHRVVSIKCDSLNELRHLLQQGDVVDVLRVEKDFEGRTTSSTFAPKTPIHAVSIADFSGDLILSLIVSDKHADLIESNPRAVKVVFRGEAMLGSQGHGEMPVSTDPGSSFVCPDCTPGRIDCGACCGIDPIDEYFSPEEDSGFDEDIYRGE